MPPHTAPASLDALPTLIYVDACLRFARLQLALLGHGSIAAASLDALVSLKPLPGSSRHAEVHGFSRASVADTLSSAYASTLAAVPIASRLFYLNTIASLHGAIGYRRKRAAILREIAAVAGQTIRLGRAEAREGQPLGMMVSSATNMDGNDAVVSLLDQVCDAYGLNLVKRVHAGRVDKRVSMIGGLSNRATGRGQTEGRGPGEDDAFGWPDLQVAVVLDAIATCEMLPGAFSAPEETGGFLTLFCGRLRGRATLCHLRPEGDGWLHGAAGSASAQPDHPIHLLASDQSWGHLRTRLLGPYRLACQYRDGAVRCTSCFA